MKRSTTKRTLLMSVLSMFLCFTMLVGTTFAWFTDEVKSGVNQIVAGNLDVSLTHTNKNVTTEADVEGNTALFEDVTDGKWEPNAMAYETFYVKNLGNLALKYKLSLNIDDVTVGKDGTTSFASVLKVAVVSGTIADRAAVEALGESAWMPFEDFAKTGDLMPTENGGTPDVDTWTVIIWWQPSDIDNNFNMNNGATGEMKATFGINLFATQLEAESDSFGSDYDEAAPIISEPVSRPAAGNAVELNAPEIDGGLSVDLPADVVDALPVEVTGISIAATAPVAGTDAATGEKTLTFSELTVVDQDGKEIDLTNNTIPVTVTLNVEGIYANGDDVVIYHDDVAIAYVTVVDNTITYTTAHFCEVVVSGCDEPVNGFVATAEALKAAVVTGGNYILSADIALDADETITVPAGVTVTLDLNGYTIAGVSSKTGNVDMFLVKGTLNVKNGTLTLEATNNQGWNAMTTIFDVTAGGVLNVNDATVENLGGTDMAFCAHLNNWGEVTLNAENVIFKSNYVGVRVFNSGYDMNNVALTDCEFLTGSGCFWVHNYTEADFGNSTEKANAAAARLNFEFKNVKAARISGSKSLVRYGFTNAIYFSSFDMTEVVAGNADALTWALENGKDVLMNNDIKIDPANMSNAYGTTGINIKNGQTFDGNGFVLDIKGAGGTWDSGINTTGGLIKNVTVTGSFRGIFINHNSTHSETVVLENVIIDGTTYTISCDQGLNQNLEATGCTFNGWTSFAATLGTAKFTDCDFGEGNGYAYCRPYAPTTFVGCDFEAGFELDARAAVTFENCTIGGEPLTAENLATLVTSNIANATVVK